MTSKICLAPSFSSFPSYKATAAAALEKNENLKFVQAQETR